ncbi:thiamine/thiamine pyrophosphate ABC transporter permease ThiP [Aggregatibacter actinomycetemcomitans]|uniref:Thiamine transport system permease protein ThiP n=1 Tax=Aggregatibacter actinomycetemcomitans TaxID=714 RepID=A0A142G2B7_AGGAC|nr:thiamine/thiamine pyrophosphate ABC transporter permease ThiP [Aggregatibacter actinomycetemcomitans]AFI87844.1 thiamine ABC transporter permease [Aggregatibacter actinomycetemcomitans D7S-1]KYK96985.1 thiamine ABC transporter permease [Aggregatibacter actinomycetemcomitans serotype d str. SA3733]AMQ94797.1 thiamine ABC transporter permease [Aggregatibacter actinomycetemcomitans]ANU82987.1 thiamine/thiamine pyrophosphate ABC transporter permease ThiP [Aggregatibacter actinomycetemcomitans]K
MFLSSPSLFVNPQFRPRHYVSGVAVMLLISLLYGFALRAVLAQGSEFQWQSIFSDVYLHHVIAFSFGQALLSALLSLFFGVLLARAFYYVDFPGKSFLLRIMSLTFVLPVLVAIFGLIGIYGASGWIAQSLGLFGETWQGSIYGLSGILTAHLFFNIPLAAKLFLQSLKAIPYEQRQLAAQLNIRGWRFVRLVEWYYLRRQILPTFSLIFMLCFTSFTVVLTLGGGPQYTTLETAIYQAILFEFDLPKAALFALLQFVFCLLLFSLGSLFSSTAQTALSSPYRWLDSSKSAVKIFHVFLLVMFLLFMLSPLLNIMVSALASEKLFTAWHNPQLWKALGYSLTIAPTSALLALLMAVALLLLSRRLQWLYYVKTAQFIINAGMVILAIPILVLAMGLFLLLREIDFNNAYLFAIVVVCNALSAMPFVLRILTEPFNNNMLYYERLCNSLGILGWQRFRLIEWHDLRAPLKYAFALAFALSLGDFTAIALFGNQDFTSLPHLLYQQLGSYRHQDAAVTAGILLLLCGGIFALIENQKEQYDSLR